MPELPLAAVTRLIKSPDPNIRVSESAAVALRDQLEDVGVKLSIKAKEFAFHAMLAPGQRTLYR